MAASAPTPAAAGAGLGSLREAGGARRGLIRLPSGQALLLVALLAVFAYLVVPPLVVVIQTSLYRTGISGLEGPATLDNYGSLLTGQGLLPAFLNTAGFGAGSTLLALALGGGLAWIVARTNAPLRRLGHAVTFVSFAMPYILYTIAWLFVLGRGGPVNAALMSWLGVTEPPLNPYSLPVMILVEGLLWSPLTFLLLVGMFQAMDPSLEESATMSGAPTLTALRRVTLPLCSPAILSVGLLIFIRAFESFDIPALVGLPGHVSVLSTGLYLRTSSSPPDYGGASAYAVVLMALVILLLRFYARFTQDASRFVTVSGKGFRPRRIDLGPWRALATAAIVLYVVVLLIVPLALIVWASFMPFYRPPSLEALNQATLANYARVLRDPSFSGALKNTLIASAMGAGGVVLATSLASWVVVKSKVAGRHWLDQLGSLPLVFPGIVLGLAYVQLYLRVPIPIYGTLWILALGYVTRYLPYGMRYNSSALLQVHGELEEAAASSGAGFWTTYRSIVLPLVAPTLLGGFLFVFMISTKELSTSILLTGPRTQVMSVSFFQLWNNGQATEVAAFGVLWAAALSVVTLGLFALGRRFGLQFQPR